MVAVVSSPYSICACRPDLLYPRDACTAEFVAGRVWVMGGVNGSGKNSAVESIAPGETVWREEPEPTPGETKSPAVPPFMSIRDSRRLRPFSSEKSLSSRYLLGQLALELADHSSSLVCASSSCP